MFHEGYWGESTPLGYKDLSILKDPIMNGGLGQSKMETVQDNQA